MAPEMAANADINKNNNPFGMLLPEKILLALKFPAESSNPAPTLIFLTPSRLNI
jgi:hypothetical protein